MPEHRSIPWVFWPLVAVWRLVAGVLELTGRAIGALLGLVCMAVGFVLTITVIGAIVGVPLLLFGFLLMLRSLF